MTAIAPDQLDTPGSRRLHRRWARGSSPSTQVIVLAGRSLRGLRDPRAIVVGLLQPLVMLLLFSQVFQNVIADGTPGFSSRETYLGYLMPAVLVTTAAGSALGSGGWLVFERNSGVFTRLRAMPIRISSILIARSLSDLVRTGIQLCAMITLAIVALHYRPAGGILSLVAIWIVSMALSCGFSWLFLAVSCWVRNVEVIQAIGFMVMFPLTFASTAYVPLAALPGALRVVAQLNPITYAVDGARSVTSATPDPGTVVKALVVSVIFTAAGMVLALKGFRRSL
jgi:ABC-2 type transport system permease protein